MPQSMIRPLTGYRPCACRDCMEIAIGSEGAMCHACVDAGCAGDGECSAPGAYGGELEPDASEAVETPTFRADVEAYLRDERECFVDDDLTSADASEAVTVPPTMTTAEVMDGLTMCLGVLTQAVHAGTRIRLECLQKGFHIVSTGTYDPCLIIPRLVGTLLAMDAGAQRLLTAPGSSFGTMPGEALGDEQHPYWAGPDAERLVMDLSLALNAAAPAGFMFTVEGAFHNMGFFRK